MVIFGSLYDLLFYAYISQQAHNLKNVKSTSMRRHDVASTSIRRFFDVVYLLGPIQIWNKSDTDRLLHLDNIAEEKIKLLKGMKM